ncbi:hypothetical protein J5N97_021995 [Dioscorea zingiberensis]|uniref:Uncharacterized protein n=1 Tax=Dioscorea zingiberensis TaxID=325984 RepID=A0A9D5C9J0_9LILI|nr:hypothetical protein J5N97_021995 [Dioscorea zingiberensis]
MCLLSSPRLLRSNNITIEKRWAGERPGLLLLLFILASPSPHHREALEAKAKLQIHRERSLISVENGIGICLKAAILGLVSEFGTDLGFWRRGDPFRDLCWDG